MGLKPQKLKMLLWWEGESRVEATGQLGQSKGSLKKVGVMPHLKNHEELAEPGVQKCEHQTVGRAHAKVLRWKGLAWFRKMKA